MVLSRDDFGVFEGKGCRLFHAQTLAVISFALVIGVMSPGLAASRSKVFYERNGWIGEQVFAANGKLEGCGASALSSGWRITLAHSVDGTWELIFSRPARPFAPDADYGVNLLADGRPIYRGMAEVLPNGLAVLSPELSEAAVASLRGSSRLVYATALGSKELRVRGLGEVIDALRACVGGPSQGRRVTVPTGRLRSYE
jgi:hypothetical protein